ncbi:MAG: DNA replication/repair protein RecF [Clostridia bacterium]|nr:DNA replication/repair protein RecF [Clostridia bacterium]
MIIEKLTLRNFRNYEETVLTPHEGVNLFFGANGSGKTNLLEAIHYCALGKSHRITGDQSAVRIGESFAACGVDVRSGGVKREISVRLVPNEAAKKVILLDQKQIKRFSDMMGCLQCVIFSPEDLGLIREGPSVRRRYLDMMISQVNRGYFIALQQYRSGLEQRNALLKNMRGNQRPNFGLLEVFEQAMAGPAEVIVQERIRVVELLSRLAAETYRGISGREEEEFQAGYHSAFRESGNVQEDFVRVMRENREEDLRLGITSAGPHRDDLNLSLNRKNMKVYASQGQIRTAALSLKLAQMKALRQMSGEPPVLLLDDVMSELDKERRMRLVSEISDYQTFITCTDETDLELESDKRIYHVSSINGKAQLELTNPGLEEEKPILKEPDFS